MPCSFFQAALGAEPPVYAHLPLLHGPDGKKLSKRHGAASVQDLRDAGYLREAVINYLALLGWGYDEETTFFTIEELQRNFTLERVSKAPAVFDERKLRWMNGRYLRELSLDDLTGRLERLTGRSGLRDAVAISQDKISTLSEFWPLARFFFDGPADDPDTRERVLGTPEALDALAEARGSLAELAEPWTSEGVEAALRAAVERTAGVEEAATLLKGGNRAVCVGRGLHLSTAHEVALKLTELTGSLVAPYSPADLMHGPVAAVGPEVPVLLVTPDEQASVSVLEAVPALVKRGAPVVLLGPATEEVPAGCLLVGLPDEARLPGWLTPVTAVVAGQLLAQRVAELRGVDVDHPGDLTKVTLTR